MLKLISTVLLTPHIYRSQVLAYTVKTVISRKRCKIEIWRYCYYKPQIESDIKPVEYQQFK